MVNEKRGWPEWWQWEIEISGHLLRRMLDRRITETDVRAMLEDASGFRKDIEPGRWVIETKREGQPWEVIVEPDRGIRQLVVVTAYMLG